MTGKLTVDQDGRLTGPVSITYNDPFPTQNGAWGSGGMMGVVVHTQVGNNPGTVAWFNNPASQASAHFCVAQDGAVVQMGPIGKGWIAWAEAAGNDSWYSIEFADDGNPANPLSTAQITAAAQIVECLSAFAGFPLQISDSPSVQGLGWHGMGGVAWGDHPNCPGDVRKAQRPQIIALAMAIRTPPKAGPYRHVATAGQTFAEIATARGTTPAHLLSVTAGALTEADVAAIAGLPLPEGWVWYSTDP